MVRETRAGVVPVLIDTVAWVRVEPPVDQLLFDDLKAAGQLH